MEKQLETPIVAAAAVEESDHMKEIILRYVQEGNSNPYALMINGPWGSGKTYYLKEVLSEEIEEKAGKKVLYVSLNGVSSTSGVSEQLFFESFKGKADEDKNAEIKASLIKFGKTGAKIASRWLKLEEGDFKGFGIKDFVNFSNCVLVFDDLERLSKSLPATEMLGFINTHFVEHNRIKVLIVGNEGEIDESFKKDYDNEKEKMIGRTLEFKPKTKKIAKSHIDGINDGKLKQFLLLHEQFILDRIEQAQIANLRTLFFFFDSLAHIVQQLEQDLLDAFGEEIVQQTLLISNEYKDGKIGSHITRDSLQSLLGDLLGSPVLYLDEVEKTKIKKEFREKYVVKDKPTIWIHSEIFDFVIKGYFDHSSLSRHLSIRLHGEHTPEVEAIKRLHDASLSSLSNAKLLSFAETIVDAIETHKYDLLNFIGAFNVLAFIFEKGILPNGDFKPTTIEELQNLYAENAESIQKNTLPETLQGLQEKQSIKAFKAKFGDSFPKIVEKVEEEVVKINEKYQQLLLTKSFTDFISNPLAFTYWKDIGSFLEYFFTQLKDDIILSMHENHAKVNDYSVAFEDWSTEEKYPFNFDKGKAEARLSEILVAATAKNDKEDYSNKPLNKYFNGLLLQSLQKAHKRAQELVAMEKTVGVNEEAIQDKIE